MDREQALYKIVKLRALAEHPNTPEHEATAARSRIAKLQERHGIDSAEKPKQSPYDRLPNDFADSWMDEMARKFKADRERANRDRAEAERLRRERIKDQDDLGRPRDPFHDPRTHAERQRDLNNSFGKNDTWYNQTFRSPASGPIPKPRCDPKMTFYDIGGEPRLRNSFVDKCTKCDAILGKGQGGKAETGSGFWCCDLIPGPRKKKSAQSE